MAAAATTGSRGRWPCISGPATPSRTGTQATATAIMAGWAWATPRTIATLNKTRPAADSPASKSHSRPRGRTIGMRR